MSSRRWRRGKGEKKASQCQSVALDAMDTCWTEEDGKTSLNGSSRLLLSIVNEAGWLVAVSLASHFAFCRCDSSQCTGHSLVQLLVHPEGVSGMEKGL